MIRIVRPTVVPQQQAVPTGAAPAARRTTTAPAPPTTARPTARPVAPPPPVTEMTRAGLPAIYCPVCGLHKTTGNEAREKFQIACIHAQARAAGRAPDLKAYARMLGVTHFFEEDK